MKIKTFNHYLIVYLAVILLISCNKSTIKNRDTKGPTPLESPKMKDLLGINAFEWDFVDDGNTSQINPRKLELMKDYGGLRHYLDWKRIEPEEGRYTFNPSHSGSWYFDLMYQTCKQEGIFVLADLKTLPDWLLATYPENERDPENIPMPYGAVRDSPSSYIAQAKAGFQFAARYGSNKNLDPSLVHVYTHGRWNSDDVNEVKIGLGTVEYIECDNERDKWWKGKKAEQTPEEYAANLSAFYDGHKGTLGKGVGVKNADPNMKVVMAGLAHPNVDYVKKMVEWCKKNRGYKENGDIDLCFDIINYHQYSLNESKRRGIAPEKSNMKKIAEGFVDYANSLNNGIDVWLTETGYDINQNATQNAIPLGNKSAEVTQADWNLRTTLLFARTGVKRVFFYMLNDVDKNNSTNYHSSGFLDFGKRRPSANYFHQVKKLMGEYQYKETLSENPTVDVYTLASETIYVLSVPDETNKKDTYQLNIGKFADANIYTLDPNGTEIKVQNIKPENDVLNLEVSETPIFVKGIKTK
jgi:hypothetical protein